VGKARSVTRTKFPGGTKPRRDDDTVAAQRRARRCEKNWRVKTTDEGVLALEPGRDFEQVFEGGADPFWSAVEYAAARLRGDVPDD